MRKNCSEEAIAWDCGFRGLGLMGNDMCAHLFPARLVFGAIVIIAAKVSAANRSC